MDKYNFDEYYVDGWENSWHRTISDKEKEKCKNVDDIDVLGEYFMKDGCISPIDYNNSRFKIAFITKEAYTTKNSLQEIENGKDEKAKNHIIDLIKDYDDPHINTPYWRRIQQWAYGILNTSKENRNS